jgi:hypothetical protein
MPDQVSGQAVATKSQRVPHGTGGGGEAGATAGGGAFVAMMLSAHASAVQAAPAITRIIAAQTPNFLMSSPLSIRKMIGRQAVPSYFSETYFSKTSFATPVCLTRAPRGTPNKLFVGFFA